MKNMGFRNIACITNGYKFAGPPISWNKAKRMDSMSFYSRCMDPKGISMMA
jgi:hypothetical protein